MLSYPCVALVFVAACTAQARVCTHKPDLGNAICKQRNAYHKVDGSCDSYIKCNEFGAEKLSCPDGLHYNPEAEWPSNPCGLPMDVPCVERTAQPQVCTHKPDLGNAICKQRNAYHKVDGSCNSYIKCTEFGAEKMSCPDGLHYNPEAEWPSNPCGHPMDVPCVERTAQPQVCTHKPDLGNAICKQRNAYHKVDGSCNSYIKCTEFGAEKMSCPDGLHYNPEAEWPSNPCGHPMDVPCVERTAQPQVCTHKPDLGNAICKQRNAYHKVDGSCNSYIKCTEFRAEKMSCPDGLHYNPEAEWPSNPCGHPMDVPCVERTAQPQVCTHKPDLGNAICKQRNAYHKVDGSCNSYIKCTEFGAEKMSCPVGLHYNPEAEWPSHPCGHPMDVPCVEEPAQPTADSPHQYGHFASPATDSDDCGQYRMCGDDKALEMDCPTDRACNSDYGRCD